MLYAQDPAVRARRGVGTPERIDEDKVCLTDPNRQIPTARRTVGQHKAGVAEQRILKIGPAAFGGRS